MLYKLVYPLVIFLTILVLAINNFSPATWLIGWDNFLPELNFKLNIGRSFFAWMESYGLGIPGGVGYGPDLIRQIFLYTTSFIFPLHWLRQIYFFITLFIGPLGVYFLLDQIVFNNTNYNHKKLASSLGALFYLLNLSTIQTFFIPFSAFAQHFAFLPWLFLITFKYLNEQNFKNLLLLILINVLAIPQANVPTVFLIFFAALVVTLISHIYMSKSKQVFKGGLVIILITLVINAFWLLPFVHFATTNSSVVYDAKINQISTSEIFLRNKQFGNLLDVALLKGFWFEITDYNIKDQKYAFLMSPWRDHVNHPAFTIVGIALFSVIIFGIIKVIKEKNKYGVGFFLLFLTSFTFLANNSLFFSWIDQLVYKIPIIAQALRFPYTKFSILASFSYSIFLAFGMLFLLNFLNKKIVIALSSFLVMVALVFLTLPAFQGNLFYSQLKTKIPQEYFDLWNFFNQQNPNQRIANFPQTNFWGWTFYKWGYGGSGILWYGMNQQVLDRTFDVWNNKSENYFWEISHAISLGNISLLEKVLEKYQINWLLYDDNRRNIYSTRISHLGNFNQIVSKSNKISFFKSFGNIALYKVNLDSGINNFMFTATNLPEVKPDYYWGDYDQAYFDLANYYTQPRLNQSNPDYYYPFRTLFTNKEQYNLEFRIKDLGDFWIFENNIPNYLKSYTLQIPTYDSNELTWVDPSGLKNTAYYLPIINLNENLLQVFVPKTQGYFSKILDPAISLTQIAPEQCDEPNNMLTSTKGVASNEILNQHGKKFLRLKSKGTKNCNATFSLPNTPQRFSYLISVESKNIQGRPIYFWIENSTGRRTEIETYLPTGNGLQTSYFIIPPLEKDDLGYTLHFDNVSFGNFQSVNDLGKIAVTPIPYNFLTQINFQKGSGYSQKNELEVSVFHPNPVFYKVSIHQTKNTPSTSMLVLSQSYNPGWIAIYLNGYSLKLIKEHYLVNNWSNGWKIDNNFNGTILIFFAPQILELLGFLIFLLCLYFIFLHHFYPRSKLSFKI